MHIHEHEHEHSAGMVDRRDDHDHDHDHGGSHGPDVRESVIFVYNSYCISIIFFYGRPYDFSLYVLIYI